jgi:hypothetical protein
MKKPLKKKKLPFLAKVAGGNARGRPDRRARGGAVSKADQDPISPTEPNAPAGGKVLQKFKKGGVAKRQMGGGFSQGPVPGPGPARSPPTIGGGVGPAGGGIGGGTLDGGGGASVGLPGIGFGSSTAAPINPPALGAQPMGGGMAAPGPLQAKRGGGVKKRQDGGPTDAEREEGLGQLKKKMTSPLGDKIGRYQEAQSRNIVDSLRPRSFGGRAEPALRKSGGALSAAQRQSLPKSDFALPGRGTGPKGAGAGSYPIPDRSHAQNALARSSGKPVAAQVRAKVKAKYPDMGS